jgi:hypothetical protein
VADTTTVLNRLIASLTAQDPTWDIGLGTVEYKILEAVAQEIATASNNNTLQNYSFDITTKVGADLDNFCALFGIYRDQGKRAIGTATFSTQTSGLTSGTLTIQNVTSGTFTAIYSPNNSTSTTIDYDANAATIQSVLSTLVPINTIVNVSNPSTGIFDISFTPDLPNGSLAFNFINLSSTSANANTSWVTAGGASANYEIPLGSQIYASSQNTGTIPIYYQTTTPASLIKGHNSIEVPIQAVLTGSSGNLTAGLVTGFSTLFTGITQVTNSLLSGGTDAETDNQLIQRWQNTAFKNLAGTEDQFLALAFGNPETRRAKVLGPQTQNKENLQIQTVLANSFKTGLASNPQTATPNTLVANITGATCATGTTTYNVSYPYSSATFNLGDFVSIEGVSETGSGPNTPSTINTYNTTGVITAINPSGLDTVSILNTTTTSYSGSTVGKMTRIPNSVSDSAAQDFTIDFEISLAATWTVSGSGHGSTAIVKIPEGTSVSGIITGLTAIAGDSITQAMNVTVIANPTINADGSASVPLYQNGPGSMAGESVLTSITFSLPTLVAITGAVNGFTSSGDPISTYTIDSNNTFFVQGQFVSISGIVQSSGGSGTFNTSGNVLSSGNDFFTILNNCSKTYTSGGAAQISYDGTTPISILQNAITSGYNNTPSIDPNQVVTLDAFFNSGNLQVAATGGFYTITTPAAALSASPAVKVPWNVGSVTTAGVLGLKNILNSLLSTYGIQCSIYRTPGASIGYNYVIDFYSKEYTHSVDTNGKNYYYFIPVEASYASSFLIWDFVSLTGPTTSNAVWSPAKDISATISQAAAINFVFSKAAAVPLVFYYLGSGGNPYSFTNTITSTISGAQYFYPQGLESVESGYNVNGVSNVASPFVDYSYSNNSVVPCQATITILNGNNYSWLYPGNVLQFSYYYVDHASRNKPIDFTGSGPSIYTNYVDVLIDGVKPQTVDEDGVVNKSAIEPSPGSGGSITSDNKNRWVLGDSISAPPEGDCYYVFSQQPVTQPYIGVYPQTVALGPYRRADIGSWQTSAPSSVKPYGNASLVTTGATVVLQNDSYINISVTSAPLSAKFMFGPATFTLTVSGKAYQVWYSGYNASSTWGSTTTLLNCILVDGTQTLSVPSGSSIVQSTITDTDCSIGDIGSTISNNFGFGIPSGAVVTSVAPGVKMVISKPVTESHTDQFIILSRSSYAMSAYSGPVGTINSTTKALADYEWIQGRAFSTSQGLITATTLSVNSEDPSLGRVNTLKNSDVVTTSTNIRSIYYNMETNLANVPFRTKVMNYSISGSSITLDNPTATSSMFYGQTVFASDFYPIYDDSEVNGSTIGLNGIALRQPTKKTRTVSWNSGTTTIYDSEATSLDVGCFVVSNNLPSQAYITSVTPGVAYTIGFNISSYNHLLLNTTGIYETIFLIPFTTMPLLPEYTNVQIFNMQYNINVDVQEVDSLVQQQRLVGVSTLTHQADYRQILVNLAVVPANAVNPTSLVTGLQNQISTYFNSIQFTQPVQMSSIVGAALKTQGVLNARLATSYDSPNFYGVQVVNPYMYYDSIQDLVQGNAANVHFQDLVILNTYTKDIILNSDQLPQLFRVNIYVRSESDF